MNNSIPSWRILTPLFFAGIFLLFGVVGCAGLYDDNEEKGEIDMTEALFTMRDLSEDLANGINKSHDQTVPHIFTFRATVTGPDMSAVIANDTLDSNTGEYSSDFTFEECPTCPNGVKGIMGGIPAGSDRDLNIEIIDEFGTVYFEGESCGFSVYGGDTTDLGIIMMGIAPYISGCPSGGSSDTGTITGTVLDASTGYGLSSVTVSVDGSSVNTTTSSSGSFTLSNVPTGSQTVSFSLSGYSSRSESVSITANSTTDMGTVTMSQSITGSDIRLVLTWGANPSDLDFYARTPSGDVIYYSNTTGTGISLDVDDTSGYGPETITITAQESGTYTFYVRNFSGSFGTTLSNSGAKVEVYTSSGLVSTVNVASGSSSSEDYWLVLGLNGTTVTTLNTFSSTTP